MSLRFNTGSAPSNNAQRDDSWKAAGYINLYVPGAEGKTKLGAVALKASNADEKRLFDWLKADQPFEVDTTDDKGKPAKRTMKPLEWLLANLSMDFREAKQDGSRFALPGSNANKPPF